MQPTAKNPFDILTLTGVTQGHFARLLGVSRVTVNTWATGARKPTPRLRKRVSSLLDTLCTLWDSGKLPIPDRHTENHIDAIILAATVQSEVTVDA